MFARGSTVIRYDENGPMYIEGSTEEIEEAAK
jgi:hypothetical protein